ncbi:hypothetical protein LguiA_029645 [Lonicera macranthoides]
MKRGSGQDTGKELTWQDPQELGEEGRCSEALPMESLRNIKKCLEKYEVKQKEYCFKNTSIVDPISDSIKSDYKDGSIFDPKPLVEFPIDPLRVDTYEPQEVDPSVVFPQDSLVLDQNSHILIVKNSPNNSLRTATEMTALIELFSRPSMKYITNYKQRGNWELMGKGNAMQCNIEVNNHEKWVSGCSTTTTLVLHCWSTAHASGGLLGTRAASSPSTVRGSSLTRHRTLPSGRHRAPAIISHRAESTP